MKINPFIVHSTHFILSTFAQPLFINSPHIRNIGPSVAVQTLSVHYQHVFFSLSDVTFQKPDITHGEQGAESFLRVL